MQSIIVTYFACFAKDSWASNKKKQNKTKKRKKGFSDQLKDNGNFISRFFSYDKRKNDWLKQ